MPEPVWRLDHKISANATTPAKQELRNDFFNKMPAVAVLMKRGPDPELAEQRSANEVARQVKLADLKDNSRLERTILRPQRIDADVARLRKYALSYKFLTDQISEQQYRDLMAVA